MQSKNQHRPLRTLRKNLKMAVDALPSKKTKNTLSKKEEIIDLAKSFVIALLIAGVFRTFLFEPFHIPSSSMKPTLLIGDYIFVSKYSYGYSRYSFPFGPPIFDGRIAEKTPERGDVIVFKLPTDPSINYIKRLIGLSGDKIQMRDGRLFINNKIVPQEDTTSFVDHDIDDAKNNYISQFREVLPNGVKYAVLDQYFDSNADNTKEYIVPEGHYFFMGDNRDNSTDSRFLHKVGFVPAENLVGRAEVILFPSEYPLWEFWHWFKPVSEDATTRATS